MNISSLIVSGARSVEITIGTHLNGPYRENWLVAQPWRQPTPAHAIRCPARPGFGYAHAAFHPLGYLSLIGAVLVMPMSLVTAPLGVRAAHAMSKRTLEVAFGCYLFVVGSRFVMSLLGGQ